MYNNEPFPSKKFQAVMSEYLYGNEKHIGEVTFQTSLRCGIKKQKQEKVSTKQCPNCGNINLLLFATLKLKTCTDCGIDIPWYLEPGQKPLL